MELARRLRLAPHPNSNNSYLSAQVCRAEFRLNPYRRARARDREPTAETRPPQVVLGTNRFLAMLGRSKTRLLTMLGAKTRFQAMLGETKTRFQAMLGGAKTRFQAMLGRSKTRLLGAKTPLLALLKVTIKSQIHQPVKSYQIRVHRRQGPVRPLQRRPIPSLQEREVRVSSNYHIVCRSVSSV